MYHFILYLHIVSVVVAIGPVIIYLPLIRRMNKLDDNQMVVFVETFRSIVWGIKQAGHVLFITGLILIWLGGWSVKSFWLLSTLIIVLGALFFLARAFTPLLKKLETSTEHREENLRELSRTSWIYTLIMLVILLFMVFKPTLW
ncbi:DUF2269 family protein [Brevibacillus ginsengisoli]|uniref:DUF2269 family protein n=1 Tax=Brevibacillus ginsengisoli TaxID=363854 RepID=UPI003CEA2A31